MKNNKTIKENFDFAFENHKKNDHEPKTYGFGLLPKICYLDFCQKYINLDFCQKLMY